MGVRHSLLSPFGRCTRETVKGQVFRLGALLAGGGQQPRQAQYRALRASGALGRPLEGAREAAVRLCHLHQGTPAHKAATGGALLSDFPLSPASRGKNTV